LTAALVGMDKDRFNSMFLDGIQVRCASGSSCNVHAGADSVENSPHRDYNNTTISLARWRATKSAMAARAMATTKRVAGEQRRQRDSVEKSPHRDYNDTTISLAMVTATRVAGDKECNGGKSDGDDEKGCGQATATAPKREVAAATRAAGDEEGNAEGGESDGDGDKEGDGQKEGEGPHSSSSSDRLPPHHMLPLLLRLATAFRTFVGTALHRSFGVSSAVASASAAAATRAAGDEEGDGKGGESDGDGNKEGDGEKEG
jgi:hypothetical protein